MFKPISALAAAALVLSAMPGWAGTPPTSMVSYGDLDLASARGRAKLALRVQRAAEAVCGVEFSFDLDEAHRVRKCRRDTRLDAQDAVALAIARFRNEASDRLAAGR